MWLVIVGAGPEARFKSWSPMRLACRSASRGANQTLVTNARARISHGLPGIPEQATVFIRYAIEAADRLVVARTISSLRLA